MSGQPIIILGAGLAGLTLGRCLRQHGVPAILLEKATSPPRNNYGITLHSRAYQPLLDLLRMDEATLRQSLAVDANRGGKGRPTSLPPIAETDAGTNAGTFRCHRGRLEHLLRDGLDIRWDQTVRNVGISPIGISIDIKDRESIKSKVLIAADGVHSQARKILAPNVAVKVLPYVVFNGKRTITFEEFQDTIEAEMQGGTVIQHRYEDVALDISISDCDSDNVYLSYSYSRPARPDDALHKPDRLTGGATQIPEQFYQELYQLEGLGKCFAYVFRNPKIREDRVLHWLMRSSLGTRTELQSLACHGVVLIGDATHAMPILGGEGGNAAIMDAVELAEHIVRHGASHFDQFLEPRYELWKLAVEQSEMRLASMHASTKAAL